MTHPDPRVAEVLDRNARNLADATTPPPVDIAEDPAAYLEWAQTRPAPQRPQKPAQPRPYLNYTQMHRRRPQDRQPPAEPPAGYAQAAARLAGHPDLGAAALETAKTELGEGTAYDVLVMHAATLPPPKPNVPERNRTTRNTPERAAMDAPACPACETLLDPDGSCFTCSQAP